MPLREHTVCTRCVSPTARLSRRRLLGRGIVIALLGAPIGQFALARRAMAGVKMAKQDAGYRDTPRGAMRCDRCVQFQPPESCNVVQGAISPSGSCSLFTPKPQ